MERLGVLLVELRHAPDPRLLLEVAFVQLTHEQSSHDLAVVLDRLERLEAAVAAGASAPPPPAPVDPTTGRVQLGGRARRDSGPASTAGPASAGPVASAAPGASGAPGASASGASAAVPARPPEPPRAPAGAPRDAQASAVEGGSGSDAVMPDADLVERAGAIWASEVVSSLKPLVRAIYSVPKLLGVRDGALALAAPNDAHRARCEQHRPHVEEALRKLLGSPIKVTIVVEGLGDSATDSDQGDPADGLTGGDSMRSPRDATVVALRPAGSHQAPADEEVDLDGLVDVPPESIVTPLERLAQVFPGSKLLDERP
jgi:DNA polymerase-3 subunit gamma/tau